MKYLIFFLLFISIHKKSAAINKYGHRSSVNGQRFFLTGHRSSVNGQRFFLTGHRSNEINRITYYRAMQGNDKALVNAELEELKSSPETLRPAFMGAMLMKRASFFGSAGSRLHYFRDGHKLLESAIQQYPENVEFRFLRLMIEEHVPPQLGYNKDIEKDCEIIRKNYKTLPEEVRQTIEDYNKKSKFLKLDVS